MTDVQVSFAEPVAVQILFDRSDGAFDASYHRMRRRFWQPFETEPPDDKITKAFSLLKQMIEVETRLSFDGNSSSLKRACNWQRVVRDIHREVLNIEVEEKYTEWADKYAKAPLAERAVALAATQSIMVNEAFDLVIESPYPKLSEIARLMRDDVAEFFLLTCAVYVSIGRPNRPALSDDAALCIVKEAVALCEGSGTHKVLRALGHI